MTVDTFFKAEIGQTMRILRQKRYRLVASSQHQRFVATCQQVEIKLSILSSCNKSV